ncbi:MAG TPA: nitronate monooxygenase, partial [Polyangiaceae bacterium]|nr:nitronate monooxygenase [Polyangiaceae bacterium]
PLKSDFAGTVGTRLPLANAPIGTASCPELAAAVSNAGALGMMAVSFLSPSGVRAAIRRVRELTDRPFAANLLLEWDQHERLEVCLEEGVELISLFWGDPAPYAERIRRGGARFIQTVGSVEEAVHAVDAGASAIIAQGWEAGGHVRGEISTLALVPQVVDAVRPTPVAAAGGIANGRGVAAAMMLGASAAVLGTRFVCSKEAAVPPIYQELVQKADSSQTVFGETFDKGWPDSNMRTLLNSTLRRWIEAGRPAIGSRPGETDIVARAGDGSDIRRYSVTQPATGMKGDLEALALYAGQSAGMVNDVRSAGEIVRDLWREAVTALRGAEPLMRKGSGHAALRRNP